MSDVERRDQDPVERLFADVRARPSDELRERVRSAVSSHRRSARFSRGSRLAFVAAVVVAMFGSLASFGGLGYAATGAENAATAVKKAVTPSKTRRVVKSAAQKQYPNEKVAVCHLTDNGSYVLIEVLQSTIPAHFAHGDEYPKAGACPNVEAETTTKVTPPVTGTLGGAGGGGLPFTGMGLAGTALAALALFGVGLLLRRAANAGRH